MTESRANDYLLGKNTAQSSLYQTICPAGNRMLLQWGFNMMSVLLQLSIKLLLLEEYPEIPFRITHLEWDIWTPSAKHFISGKETLSVEAKTQCAERHMHTLTLTHRFLQARLPCVIKGNAYQALITKSLCSSEWCAIIRQAAQISSCHKVALPAMSFNNLFSGLQLSISYARTSVRHLHNMPEWLGMCSIMKAMQVRIWNSKITSPKLSLETLSYPLLVTTTLQQTACASVIHNRHTVWGHITPLSSVFITGHKEISMP